VTSPERTRAAEEGGEASRALCRKHGFREVGIYEKHGKLDGRWFQVVIIEGLIAANLT
jgi:phosphinothricin acetyltransferase